MERENPEVDGGISGAKPRDRALLRSVLKLLPDIAFVHDAAGNILDANQRACEDLGFSREELLALRLPEIEAERSSEELASAWRRASGGKAVVIEGRQRRRDGSTFPVEVRVGPLEDGLLLSQVRDLSGLRRAESRLAMVQRIANLGNWEYDLDRDEAYWSDEMYRIFGCEPGSFTPNYKSFLKFVHPGDKRAVRRSIRAVLYGGENASVDYRIVRPGGEVRAVNTQYELVRDGSGRPVRMVGTVHDITERKALEEQLVYQALHDPLTRLPNRSLFLDRLQHALARDARRETSIAILFLDLDNFKVINDTFGHDVGDMLLFAVARRLSSCVRAGDTVARLGGDEFTVLLEDIDSPREAAIVADRIKSLFEEPFEVENHILYVTASIGVAPGIPYQSGARDLLRNADRAMYRAKEKGKARYEIYTSGSK